MSSRKDRRRRLADQFFDRKLCVGTLRSVCARCSMNGLTSGRYSYSAGRVGGVLLECERQLGAALDVREQRAEGAETESSQRFVQLRSAHDHEFGYAAGGSSPLWHSGHQ